MEIDNSSGATQYGLGQFNSSSYANDLAVTDGSGFGGWLNRLIDSQGSADAYNAYQSALDREYNAEQAQKQRDFEERMSNTAYQRAIADMKSAGLNPVLGFSGSSTPSGVSASSSGARSSSNGGKNSLLNLLSTIIKIFAGLI